MRIKESVPAHKGLSLAELQDLFNDDSDKARVGKLVAAGYLEPYAEAMAHIQGDQSNSIQPSVKSDYVSFFRDRVVNHYLRKPIFFNLPNQVESLQVDVGLVGVPISTLPVSTGTTHSTLGLRQYSQKFGFWFDVAKNGAYSEIGCDDSKPSLMCKDVVIKDFGDLGGDSRTVGDLFRTIDNFIASEICSNRIRPLFIGGDHAVTFPIVDSLLKHYPDLVLLHLDAHNDLFYADQVSFSHANPILGLLMHSGLKKVFSFGLRTNCDMRVDSFRQLDQSEEIFDRLSMFSLGALRARLRDIESLKSYLKERIGEDTPVYLTIDLDVLSDGSISGQLSTPAGHGLEFYELYNFVNAAMDSLNVIGGDVVELNVDTRNGENEPLRDTTVLLIQMIHGLAKNAQRYQDKATLRRATNVFSDDNSSTQTGRTEQARIKTIRNFAAEEHPLFSQKPEKRDISSLSYDTFVDEFVLPGLPVILTGCGGFEKLSRWSLDYFLERVPRSGIADVTIFSRPFEHNRTRSVKMTLWDILAKLRSRRSLSLSGLDERYSLTDWNFLEALPKLADDYNVPAWFDMDMSHDLGFPANSLKWVYMGEAGTGSPTHLDVAHSSAWLMLASGRKHWRFVVGDDVSKCDDGSGWMDLFSPDTALFPGTGTLSGYDYVQSAGEIIWTPPGCLHAVRNLEDSIALTQNYIDLTNLSNCIVALGNRQGNFKDKEWLSQKVSSAIKRADTHGFGGAIAKVMPQLRSTIRQFSEESQRFQQNLENTLRVIERP
ncbi:hypothetical protein A3709_12025 [Halioglobus sp. HI00S01]|uniref:arginase family protein n=1 Tax=Halioglobus sp. HI00S01 TaxID=1822214 RepID=UPI0007C2789D|nr:arginase family protein [Halioglobus sp. HI00S01]KZX60312.1 hypothetical protein A3709_12025 [Halioglobus sp. HI00S01]